MGVFSKTIQRMVERLERSEIDYMLVGSVASTIYGEPRLTRDIDIVISLKLNDVSKFMEAFSAEDYYVPPREIISQEVQRCGQFNLMDHKSAFKIDIILSRPSPHSQSEFSRKVRLKILPGLDAWIGSPEDVILKKLQFYLEGRSEKHLLDIKGIVANSRLNENYLQHWIAELRLEEAWKNCLY